MFLLNWLRQYYEIRNSKICESCEVLKHELEVVRLENQKLIDRILEKPKEEVRIDTTNLKPVTPQHVSWRIRQQMLEAEDRKKARLMKEARDNSAPSGGQEFVTDATTEEPMTTAKLEEELGVTKDAS